MLPAHSELRAAYIPSPRAGVNLNGQLTVNGGAGRKMVQEWGESQIRRERAAPLARPWIEVTRFCREQE